MGNKPPMSSAGSAGPAGSNPRWVLPPRDAVELIENFWIPMTDGTRLAGTLWRPRTLPGRRVPAVMEYIPYRKSDGTRAGDAARGDYLAAHGIAFARLDIRGSGESQGGVLRSEYTDEEQADGVAAIAWLARQPWCNGAVGMRGISWGGFNSLQIAALAPPALKAVMPMCFADNRFTDDAHYIGGALALANFEWGTMFQTVLAGPPDPRFAADDWRSEWQRRLEAMPPILSEWLRHQRFDGYWQRASVGLAYEQIRCPVYCVGGWCDGYNNSIIRALERLTVPRKALIGPWSHFTPDEGTPGPALDWAVEEVRWWHEWLYGVDTGIMDEPMLRAFMPERTAAEVFPSDVPGHWIAEDHWPPPSTEPRVFHLNTTGLGAAPGSPRSVAISREPAVGLCRTEWIPFAMRSDLAREQTPDDQRSTCFDSEPLGNAVEILGRPTLTLTVTADAPVAQLAARLCEVAPDGTSWLVTYGLLNLAHRNGHHAPEPLVPGARYEVRIALNLVAHRFKRGSRLRLALSTGLWPLVWRAPTRAAVVLTTGGSRLTLPARCYDRPEPPFEIPVKSVGTGWGSADVHTYGPDSTGRIVIDKSWPTGVVEIPGSGTRLHSGWSSWRLELDPSDPARDSWSGDFVQVFERPDWGRNEIRARFELRATTEAFRLTESIRATHDGSAVFEREWQNVIERDLM